MEDDTVIIATFGQFCKVLAGLSVFERKQLRAREVESTMICFVSSPLAHDPSTAQAEFGPDLFLGLPNYQQT